MTMSPIPATSILSIPLGPIVERTVSARTFAAMILALWASLPLDREVPSFRIRTRISDMSNHTLSEAWRWDSGDKHMQRAKMTWKISARHAAGYASPETHLGGSAQVYGKFKARCQGANWKFLLR